MAYSDNSELAQESTLILLRRLLKEAETLAVVDAQQRQRLTLDAVTAGLALPTVTTVSSVTNVAAQTGLAGMDREMYINQARMAYAGIRNRLFPTEETTTTSTSASPDDDLALESTLILLRRILKEADSLSVVDGQQRQRLTLDAITAGVTLPTVSTVSSVTNVAAQTGMAGMDREMYINQARLAYSGIRGRLTTPVVTVSSVSTTLQKGDGIGGFLGTDLSEPAAGDFNLGISSTTGTTRKITATGTSTTFIDLWIVPKVGSTVGQVFLTDPNANVAGATTLTQTGNILHQVYNSGAAQSPNYTLYRARGSYASQTAVNTGDSLGIIWWQGKAPTSGAGGAKIEVLVNGTTGTNLVPSDMVFSVSAPSTGTMTERMRIAANGLITFSSNVGGGGTTNFLRADGTWAPAGTGNVSNTGTPAANQVAIWTNATTIQGVGDLVFTYATPYSRLSINSGSGQTNSQVVMFGTGGYFHGSDGATSGTNLEIKPGDGITNGNGGSLTIKSGVKAGTGTSGNMTFYTDGTLRLTISNAGLFTFGSNVGGGGSANFLRADGTWAAPGGTFSGSIASTQIAVGSGANAISGSATYTFSSGVVVQQGALAHLDMASSTGTNQVYYRLDNTGGSAYVGIENSTGGWAGTGVAYAMAFYTSAMAISFLPSGTERARFSTAGNLSLGGSLGIGIGLGTAPSYSLDVSTTVNGTGINSRTAGTIANGDHIFYQGQYSSTELNIGLTSSGSNNPVDVFFKSNQSRNIVFYQSTAARMIMKTPGTLGSTAGNNNLIYQYHAGTGNTNDFMNNIWMVRRASGSDWITAKWHDGISIDSSFFTPGTDTCTYWERSPNEAIQRWGHQGTVGMSLDSSGNLVLAANVTAYGSPSDRTLKHAIKPLENGLDVVRLLKGVTFRWNYDTLESTMVGMDQDVGFIAQDIQEVLPTLVRADKNGILSIRDRGLMPYVVKAVQEVDDEVTKLKKRVKELETKLGMV